jgi:hypothetical protein
VCTHSFILLHRHTYFKFAYGICTMSFIYSFFARVMVGLASPPLEVDTWLAIGRRPLGRRLSPRAPPRRRPPRRDRAAPEARLPRREPPAPARLPMAPPHPRTPVVEVGGRRRIY